MEYSVGGGPLPVHVESARKGTGAEESARGEAGNRVLGASPTRCAPASTLGVEGGSMFHLRDGGPLRARDDPDA